jgi:formamidopyrimidine-DNA glycosylase
MPELPEVETIRRALQARLVGRRFVEVVQRRPDLRFPLPARLPSRLRGRRIEAVRRRAKYLLAELDDGHVLIVHLGMSGRLVLGGAPAGLHEHLTFGFDDGAVLRFVDARRFGSVDLTAAARLGAHPRLVDLGLEPLDPAFTGPALRAALGTTQTPLKVALMDQGRVVGVGNIYACEALFRARLSPRRAGGSLGTREATRLARAIQAVLRRLRPRRARLPALRRRDRAPRPGQPLDVLLPPLPSLSGLAARGAHATCGVDGGRRLGV